MSAREAIDGLIAELKSQGHAHAVWASDDHLMVAIDPEGGDVSLPDSYMGWPITRVPWGAKKEPLVLRSDPPLPPTTIQGLAQFDRSLAVAVQDVNAEARMANQGMNLPTFAGIATAFDKLQASLEVRGQRILNRIGQTDARGATLEAKAMAHLDATDAKLDQYGQYFDQVEKAIGGNGAPVDDPTPSPAPSVTPVQSSAS